MDDFFKGYSQGMTGSTGGNPSQSVLEAMGRDAARNQWNGNQINQQPMGGAYAGSGAPGIGLHRVLHGAAQKMGFKRILRHFGIGIALMLTSVFLNMILPQSLEWLGYIPGVPAWIIMMWASLQFVVFALGKFFGLFIKKEPESEA